MFNIFAVGALVPPESSKEKIGENLGCGFPDQKGEKTLSGLIWKQGGVTPRDGKPSMKNKMVNQIIFSWISHPGKSQGSQEDLSFQISPEEENGWRKRALCNWFSWNYNNSSQTFAMYQSIQYTPLYYLLYLLVSLFSSFYMRWFYMYICVTWTNKY